MNLPISLTLLRIFFVPIVVVLLLTTGHNMDLWAVGVFLLAATTDLLDGYLARKRAQVTTLGILLDPIADKLLISAAFISLVYLRLVAAWMAVVIIGREFAVSGLRGIAAAEGFTLEASELGKTKMVSQVVAITVIVLEKRHPLLRPLGDVLLWMVVLFALASAAQYFFSFWRRLDARLKRPAPIQRVVLRTDGKAGRKRCCSSLTPKNIGCSSWREPLSRRSCAWGECRRRPNPQTPCERPAGPSSRSIRRGACGDASAILERSDRSGPPYANASKPQPLTTRALTP